MVAVAVVVAEVVDTPPALAQSRSACADAPGNIRDQVGGNILGELLPDWVDNPWEPEGLDEVWDRCIEPYLRPPPAGYDPGGPPRGSNSGDPHIVTQDGVRYDFHGAGDYVLLRSLDNDVEAHVRYRRFGSVSTFAGVAVRHEGTTVTIESVGLGEQPLVTVDGEPVETGTLGWFDVNGGVVVRAGESTMVAFDSGLVIGARRLALTVVTPPDWAGTLEGLQGNGDGDPSNDPALADGTPVDANDSDVLYGEFFDDWYVEPGDSLFTMPFDEVADGPIRPEETVTLSDLAEAEVALATQTCLAVGLAAGSGLEECIFDVAYTGDESWADEIPVAARQPTIPAAAFHATIESNTEIPGRATITGNLTDRFAADEFVVAAASEERYLRVNEPCSDSMGPVAVALVNGIVAGSWPLRCAMSHRIPSESFVLRVVEPYGGTPDYGFIIEPARVASLGAIALGVPVSGQLAAGDTAIGTLDVTTGSRLLIAPSGSCATTVSVVDANGEPQATPRASCVGNGPFTLGGDAPYSIVVSSTSGGSYGFVVTPVGQDTVGAVVVGNEVVLEVATAGQQASTTFDLEAGQRVYVETITDVDGDLVLTGPDGVELADAFAFTDLGLVEAAVSGSHTITLVPSGSATGEQTIRIYDVVDDTVVTGSVGSTVDVTVVTPGQRASVELDLEAGERVYVETVTEVDGDLVLTGPDGAELADVFAFTDLGLVEAAVSGSHTITLVPSGSATGTQALQLHGVDPDGEFAIIAGRENTFQITTPGQVATGTLALAAGDVVSLERVETVPGRLRVIDPEGEEIVSRISSLDVTLETPESGVYSIEFDPSNANTGRHVVRIEINPD